MSTSRDKNPLRPTRPVSPHCPHTAPTYLYTRSHPQPTHSVVEWYRGSADTSFSIGETTWKTSSKICDNMFMASPI